MSNILFIVEGEKDEPKYIQQFIKYHEERMKDNGNQVFPIVVQSYGTLIFDLYKRIADQLSEDEFETIPVLIEILKEKDIDYDERLNDYEQFSDIFLFFDLDAHYYVKREGDKRNHTLEFHIKRLLSFFNESTEKGKLLISYPMFEALKCFSDAYLNRDRVLLHLFNIYDVRKHSSTTFKKQYKLISSDDYKNSCYSSNKVKKLVQYFIVCSLFLVENEENIANSEVIFSKQYEKFINPHNQVVILSSFPQFIVDIFGTKLFYESIPVETECKSLSSYSSNY